MNIFISICARGGSKGIPDKNIKILNGLPLIAYTIKVAQEFATVQNADIGLSTDDMRIKDIAKYYRIHTGYTRPSKLATDDAGKQETIKDLLEYYENTNKKRYDIILDLDVTSPLRNCADLLKAFESFIRNPEALNLFSVNKAARNPYFNMVEQNKDGFYTLSKQGNFNTRQESPEVYELNASFYFYRRSFYDQAELKTISSKSIIYLIPHICFDIDHPIDYEFLSYLMVNNKLDFNL